MKKENYRLIDNYIMNNLDRKLTIQNICDECFISRSLVREYVQKSEYKNFDDLLNDYKMQESISRLNGIDKIHAIQNYLFQFLTEDQLNEFTNDNRIVFLYVMDDYKKYYNIINGFLLQCRHKINPVSSLDLNADPLYQAKNKHLCICTIVGGVDDEELDPTQLYRIMHFSNYPKYTDHVNVQEFILKKFHPKFENFHIMGTMYILELYS